MPRRTVAIPIFVSLAASCLLVFVVASAQVPGGPETNSNAADPFNACLLGTCEPQRMSCVASAGGNAELLGRCEASLSACLDACRAGNTGYVFPPLPAPEPEIELEPVPAALIEPFVPLETEADPAPAPVAEPGPEPEPDTAPAPREEPRPVTERSEPPEVPEEEEGETEERDGGEGPSEEERTAAADLIEAQILEDDVRPIPGMTSVSEEGAEDAEWVASQEEPGQDVSDYVILIGDLDDDGLPDAIEGDIPEDDPTAEALSSGAPLGQPDGAGEEDPAFVVEEGEPEEGAHILRGRCDPDAICLIYIYSYIPVVLAVKTDASGNYVYDISDYVGSGSHVAYVTVTDKTGKIAKKSSPLSFVIPEALAADEPEALPALDVDVEEVAPNYLIYYVLGATGLVLVGIGLALSLRKKAP